MPLKDLLDPQGKAVMGGLQNLGLNGVEDVRIGKHITLRIEAESEAAAKQIADDASRKLLANPVMEFYEIEMVNRGIWKFAELVIWRWVFSQLYLLCEQRKPLIARDC